MTPSHPVYLIKGDDPSLVSGSVSKLIAELVENRSADLVVEEVAEDADISVVLDVCETPAFLTDRRVVVVREAGRFKADEIGPLLTYLAAPMFSTSLVMVGGGGSLPTRLMKAIKEHGSVIDVSVPVGKGRTKYVADRLKTAPVRLDRNAQELLLEKLGDDIAVLDGLFDALTAAYGEGASLSVAEVDPYLSLGGIAAPWELTDAIDTGDTATALVTLRRMLEGGQRHPLVVIATLQRHVGAWLRLDGSGVQSESEAASLLGMAPFPAKKALTQSRRVGSKGVMRAARLVSEADVDLRGRSSWPSEAVLEVLVARLSKLSPSSRSQSSRSRKMTSTSN